MMDEKTIYRKVFEANEAVFKQALGQLPEEDKTFFARCWGRVKTGKMTVDQFKEAFKAKGYGDFETK